MKQSKYLVTGDDISEMGLSLLPGKEHLSGKKALTKYEIVSTYYASITGIDEDNRCVTYERIAPSVYLNINKSSIEFLASGGSNTITIDTNLSYDQISVNHSSTRFSVTKKNNIITITAKNLGTTEYSQIEDTLTISGGGISKTCTLIQEENTIESYENDGYSVELYTLEGINYVPASGGSLSIRSITHSYRVPVYTSGASGSRLDTQGTIANVSVSPSGWSLSSSTTPCTVSTSSWGTVVNDVYNGVITGTFNGVSTTLNIYQQANEVSYGEITISGGRDITLPASGGTASTVSGVTATQKVSYSSGSTSTVKITDIRFPDSITADNLGTTETSLSTYLGRIRAVAYGNDGYTKTKEFDVYQEANRLINPEYNYRLTEYGTPSISIGEGLTAAGGSAEVIYSVYNTYTYNAIYTSGATGPDETEEVLGSATLTLTTNGNNRFSLSGSTISHNNMGTNLTTDTVTVKATNSYASSYYNIDSVSIENTRDVQSISGGIYTYGDVIVGTLVNGTIPASGGSATATAGNGSQSWTKTAEITTYIYDSGYTKEEATSAATSGTNSITPNITSISGSASSKRTTISGQTIVKSQTITWTGNKNNSGSTNISTISGTIYIYQKANQIEEKFLDLPDFNTTVNLEWNPDMINMQSYLGNVYKKESYTSDAISAGTLIGIAGTYPATVENPTVISQDSGMNINPSSYMLIIGDNTSNIQRTAVLEWEIVDSTGEYDSFIKRMTIIQAGKPISIGYGSLALTTSAGMFPPYVTNYKIDFRSNSTRALIESCIGSPSLLTGQIPILQSITDSVVDKASLGGTYLSVLVELSNADTGEGSLSPVIYSGVLSGSDIQSLKNGTDKVLIVS